MRAKLLADQSKLEAELADANKRDFSGGNPFGTKFDAMLGKERPRTADDIRAEIIGAKNQADQLGAGAENRAASAAAAQRRIDELKAIEGRGNKFKTQRDTAVADAMAGREAGAAQNQAAQTAADSEYMAGLVGDVSRRLDLPEGDKGRVVPGTIDKSKIGRRGLGLEKPTDKYQEASFKTGVYSQSGYQTFLENKAAAAEQAAMRMAERVAQILVSLTTRLEYAEKKIDAAARDAH
jgi:hypothetical protein